MVLGDAQRRQSDVAIADQADTDMLGLQLGYACGRALLRGGDDGPKSHRRCAFVPSSRPGARLPHGWLNDGARRRSTLDLVRLDSLTLLVVRTAPLARRGARAQPAVSCIRVSDAGGRDQWWRAVAGMRADGALLVRPDQHIAFRSRGAVADAPATLRRAVAATSVPRHKEVQPETRIRAQRGRA
jgi:2,4-dichlorophenol 6-monooxygenase